MSALPPLPVPGWDNQEFWDGCKRHELRLQRCTSCNVVRFYPRPVCPACTSLEFTWITATGRGHVFSWTIVHPPTLPAFAAETPYAVGLIQLDEKVFMVGQIRGVAPHAIEPGRRVRVEFDDVSEDLALPHWRVV